MCRCVGAFVCLCLCVPPPVGNAFSTFSLHLIVSAKQLQKRARENIKVYIYSLRKRHLTAVIFDLESHWGLTPHVYALYIWYETFQLQSLVRKKRKIFFLFPLGLYSFVLYLSLFFIRSVQLLSLEWRYLLICYTFFTVMGFDPRDSRLLFSFHIKQCRSHLTFRKIGICISHRFPSIE